jgi:methylmalonyl-CoA/ethylmalonyl-CoA epimerase
MKSEFHHVGYATKSISKSLVTFQALGYQEVGPVIIDELLGVRIQFISQVNHDDVMIELVENLPDAIEQPVSIILKQRSGAYHLAFLVDSIEDFSEVNSLRRISRCRPAVAFQGSHVQFFMSRDGGILELISKSMNCECENRA